MKFNFRVVISAAIMLHVCLVFVAFQLSSGYDNIAFRKPAQQQYPFCTCKGEWGADLAVDGLRSNLSSNGRQCTISADEKQTARWWVDLGGVFSIHHITIYYRTDNVAWDEKYHYKGRFLGFHVYVSNTTNKLDGHLCVRDTNYNVSTILPVANINCPVHGKYVIYYNERLPWLTYPGGYSTYAFNELCEVEVYGCPVPGYYGPDCTVPCPDNCRYCHIDTGACQGCKPGYQGHQCELPCSPHYYGELCKKPCGSCSAGVTCNNVDGTCPNGCDVGFYGYKCITTCPVGWHGENCSQPCGNCLTCDRFNGQCTSPCYPGWKGQYCIDVENSIEPYSFYGVLAALFVSAIVNAVMITYACMSYRKERLGRHRGKAYTEGNGSQRGEVNLSVTSENVGEQAAGTYEELQDRAPPPNYENVT
ncbi:uncharacterized protein LOC125663256 [Ostrea edulis]|uniref:uncharacterized protein LOC125663256 n=1 Tax=Ostrea edulis TaxID=37623 RepID=UPI0024AFB119|nr:uncharacterized protein LOC125663256 [Ostrea edulis]